MKRADRRPNGYNLAVHRAEATVDNSVAEGQSLPSVEQDEGQTMPTRGANSVPTRSKACPRNVLNHLGNRLSPFPPPCGQCDARSGDPVSARMVWLDTDRTRSVLCPRCHPAATGSAGGAQ